LKLQLESNAVYNIFEFIERSKAVILLSSIRGLEALQSLEVPDDLKDKEKRIKEDLLTYKSLIYKENQNKQPDTEKTRYWENQLFNLKLQYDSLVSYLENLYPSFFKLRYDNTVVSIKDVQDILAPDQAMLEYAITDSSLFIFAITKDDFEVFKSVSSKDLRQRLTTLASLFKGRQLIEYTESDYATYTTLASGLYEDLILPARELVNGRRLIIIPDAELGYLSFDLLLTRQVTEKQMNFRTLPYLVLEHPVSYAGSATLLHDAVTREGRAPKKDLLAYAPVYDGKLRFRSSSGPATDSLLSELMPIPGVEEEVMKILRIYRGKKFLGLNATEKSFKENAGEYNILHLAMHTVIDDQNPMYSKLVFSSGSGNEDGLLNTYELFNLDLDGSLAVLSACNTGTGKLERGEGIISLARGFIYAGIPSIVMTLWEVEDYSSADLMTAFYEKLRNGLPQDRALQEAKAEYLRSADALRADPYFWAGFVHIGKADPVKPSFSFTTLYVVLFLLLLGMLIFLLTRQVYSRKKKIN
jgi:CHAT domain-containing protein